MNNCKIDKYSELNKPFKIIAFDWDGTAVPNRAADAAPVAKTIRELMELEVIIFVVTGTNFDNIDRQFCSHITGKCKENLYIATNRGSEIYGFDENSQQKLLYRREATVKENELLNKTVERTRDEIENSSNVKVNIIYDRLNRRKLDLIPEWSDPPKDEIDKLLLKVQSWLENNGFAGGIQKAFKLMTNIAKTSGFTKAKITSDIKHIEIGLTDKSDSICWMLSHIAEKKKISDNKILIGGDEFGNIGGFEGSDYKMVIKNHPEITYFSVGIEPNGVPPPILYSGGGPECFLRLMKNQILLLKSV